MKKLFLFGLAISALVLGSCSSKDDINDTKIVVNPNVTDSKLDQKSGGVYFVSTLAGEYIFRLNLKNGDDAMTCEMFHNEVYSELAPAETAWEPGEVLENLQFSSGEVKLILSLNEDGEGEAQVFVEDTEFEAVIFKSTAKEPVKIYSGKTESTETRRGENYNNTSDEVMIIQGDTYFYGTFSEYYYFGFDLVFSNKTSSTFTYQVPDAPDAHINGRVWERDDVQYDEDTIFWEYEDSNDLAEEYFHSILTLHRRFKE